jgi:nucleoporin GLE1
LYIALLEVLGGLAREAWGGQWIKLLALIYSSATQGVGPERPNGESRALLGGNTPEGRAARVRVQLEIERLLKAS